MRFRRLGRTESEVSVVGLGTFQFGGGWGKSFSKREVRNIVSAAHDCGINLLDTAECYGPDHLAESLIGQAIASSREHWILATKFGHVRHTSCSRDSAWDAQSVRLQLEESLRALGTDYIDIYQFHSGSNQDFDNDELWEMLRGMRKGGKIRYLGISLSRKSANWRRHQVQQATEIGVDVIQVKLNRIEREAETEVLPECAAKELGVLARVPLASGLLSGKHQQLIAFPAEDVRSEKYGPDRIKALQAEIDHIIRTELPEGASLPEYALAWCLAHTAVSSVIPGSKTVDHVIANAAVADSALISQIPPLDFRQG